MPAILACVNLKGGVGKTAIAVNFAAYCGRQGMRTLLVDCDPKPMRPSLALAARTGQNTQGNTVRLPLCLG